jgi:hypothetical protein
MLGRARQASGKFYLSAATADKIRTPKGEKYSWDSQHKGTKAQD